MYEGEFGDLANLAAFLGHFQNLVNLERFRVNDGNLVTTVRNVQPN
jgi:hypothetical protein